MAQVAIARAILRAPRLLLCDEATAALDTQTEAAVSLALRKASEGRTSLIVAHRLATVMNCDRIYVLEHGRVTECGTHRAPAPHLPNCRGWRREAVVCQPRSGSKEGCVLPT